jgi:hypothetical protein
MVLVTVDPTAVPAAEAAPASPIRAVERSAARRKLLFIIYSHVNPHIGFSIRLKAIR